MNFFTSMTIPVFWDGKKKGSPFLIPVKTPECLESSIAKNLKLTEKPKIKKMDDLKKLKPLKSNFHESILPVLAHFFIVIFNKPPDIPAHTSAIQKLLLVPCPILQIHMLIFSFRSVFHSRFSYPSVTK